jgi:hypothetical protein
MFLNESNRGEVRLRESNRFSPGFFRIQPLFFGRAVVL